jgi:hypothetical protein
MTLGAVAFLNFTVFEDATFDLCPGVNVLIGTNGTGKTHAMKAMYAILRALEKDLRNTFWTKFGAVFRPDDDDVRRLIRRGSDGAKIYFNREGAWESWIDIHASGGNNAMNRRAWVPSLYIPSREVLSMYEGFIAAYQNRELSFDETFFDLCVALNANLLRGERLEQVAPLVQQLEALLGGKVLLEGNRFYVQPVGSERYEAHLLAEGLRKIATLTHLVANGSLAPGGVLFWDEPETNLNPRLITQLVDFLLKLASHGVQVILSTHDYLLSHRLSLVAEYRQATPGVRFFGLSSEGTDGPVRVTRGDTLADLPENPIVEEFARHYDFERALFDRSQGG